MAKLFEMVGKLSALMIEALMAGKKVLSYSFVTPPAYSPYAAYSPHLVAFTREELSRNLDRILKEGQYVDEGQAIGVAEAYGVVLGAEEIRAKNLAEFRREFKALSEKMSQRAARGLPRPGRAEQGP